MSHSTRKAVAAVDVKTVLCGCVRRLGGERRTPWRRAPARAGRPSVESPARLPGQELRSVLGHQRVRQGVGNGLIGADPDAERLDADVHRPRRSRSPRWRVRPGRRPAGSAPHRGQRRTTGGPVSFRQDFDLAGIAPAGQRQGAHVGGAAHVGWPAARQRPDRPAARERRRPRPHRSGAGAPRGRDEWRARRCAPLPRASSSSFRAPQAARRRAAAAGSAKGMGATRRPASSAIRASSRSPPPPPPMSSGMPTPRAPVAIRWAQRSGSWPRGSAARTRAGSASLPKRAENVCRTNCWSSVRARFTRAIPSSRQFGSLTPSGARICFSF